MENQNDENLNINKNDNNDNNNNNIHDNLSEKKLTNNDQKKFNNTISSDTLRILSLLKSYPSTATSSSFQVDNKQNNLNNTNNNTLKNTNLDNNNDNNIDNLSYDEIKAICLKIFMMYATPINGQFFLGKRYIFQIFSEMEILSEKCLSSVDLEILNQQINKKGDRLSSDQFLDLLAKICCLLDDNFYKDKRASFIKLIKLYLEPYLQKKEKSENINELNNDNMNNNNQQLISNSTTIEKINYNLNFKDLILNEYQLDKNSYDLLMSIIEGLKMIYLAYFSYIELSLCRDYTKLHKDSFKIFIKFLREFEIIPYLIKQRLAELYWSLILSLDINELYKSNNNENEKEDENNNNNQFKSLLNNKKYDIGKVYTFKKFFILFSHMSYYYYYPIKSKTQGQKLLYFIEKIYKSKGYQNLPNLYSKTFNKRYTIIPPISIVEKINKDIIDYKNLYNINNNLKEEKEYKLIIQDLIGLNDDNFNSLEKYLGQLKNIFDIYCHIFDRYEYGKLSFSNFQKLFIDGEIISNNEKSDENKSGQKNLPNIEESKMNLNLENQKDSKSNNLNSPNKKNDNSYSEEISKINKDNLHYSKVDLSENNTFVNINMSENKDTQSRNSQLDNKKLISKTHSTQSYNTNNINNLNKENKKPKLRLIDLNIIVATICGNTDLSEYQNNLNNMGSSSLFNDSTNISDIHSNSTKKNKSYKIDFILFLKSLCFVSLKLYPNPENDINKSMKNFLKYEMEEFLSILNKKSLNHTQNNEFSELFKLISSNEELIQLMNDIIPLIKGYFDFYSENIHQKERLCDFNSFFHFFKDYEIYPNWINISNLSKIFHTQIYLINKENNNFLKNIEKINFNQFIECFIVAGLSMNSGTDFDMVDKVLFMIDKMFSENYGKTIKKIKSLPSFKEDYYYFERILKEKYPSYYERKYSNCGHRYDNKFYWVYEKNYGGDKTSQQIDFGELFNKEKVKFDDVFEDIIISENKQTYKNNSTINEMKED